MRYQNEQPPTGRSDPCLYLQLKRRHRRKKHQVVASSSSSSSSPSSVLCATLFFAYIFSPFSNDNNGLSQSSGAGSSHGQTRGSYGVNFSRVPSVVQAFSTPLPARTSLYQYSSYSRKGTEVFSSTAELAESSLISTRQELEKMTVKQLKSYIQENGIQIPKGQSSSLKLKKQIVEFIWNYQNGNGGGDGISDDKFVNGAMNGANGNLNGHDEVADSSPKAAPPQKKRNVNKRSMGTGMPPLPTMETSTPSNKDSSESGAYVLTPKDRIVLDVLNRYPPLHESVLNACINTDDLSSMGNLPIEGITTANIEHCDLSAINYVVPTDIGEDDIRHEYHPMMANATQSDLDVVFIGTASCTPGVTRGVSCTALRLNWRTSSRVNINNNNNNNSNNNNHREKSLGEKQRSGTYVEDRGPTGGTWLFDCGESTQLSVQKTPSVKPGKISKIFITHCHGDHSFGLPGLLCLAGTDRNRDDPPVEIYGPEGLRMWLRVAVRYSVSRVVPPYRVHELMDVPMAPEWEEGHRRNGRFYFQLRRDAERSRSNGSSRGRNGSGKWGMQGLAGEDPQSWISRAPMINLEPSKDFGEIEGGRDIYPNYDHPQSSHGAPVWEVLDEDDVMVHAAPMSHGVPCVGYVVRENDRPGRLRPDLVQPLIEANRAGLKEAGVKNPMKIMAVVKNLPVGGSYEFPDGTVLRQEEVVEPPRRGRKVVICGDTADCRALEGLAKDADVLVHEATNTFLPGVDKDGSVKMVTRDAKIHGHSTPFMAGEFAKRIGAKKLIMNHFSARYKGDQSVESMTIMTRMERQAMKASGLSETSVAAAWDFMVLPIARSDEIA
eukprot:CAMPEP_0183711978 /NCGR_PEP_ID=MMETSP0737-20130205/7283_1 /TAXON_ID=385413 /ORGANISM="Thalassiosira miniscula, Strain CCMP1093" /LENGTH=831 /DNA_ID=CAMNT_0025940551 /DNA_START=47 /DNA_END=2542 /DNA_ORIENTATION=-